MSSNDLPTSQGGNADRFEVMTEKSMLNEALRLIRVFHDLKQFELAKNLGVSKSHISEIEKGSKSPSLGLINKYADEFNIAPSSIMFFAEELPNAQRGDKVREKIASKVLDILKFVEREADGETPQAKRRPRNV